MKTIFLNPKKIEQKWYLIDAEGEILGHIAVKAADILRGKHKPYFTPHQNVGDFVIIINSEKTIVTGQKRKNKLYYKHSGYPGGLKVTNFEKMISKKPTFPVEQAIRGMLPKNRLGRQLFRNLKVYAGANHPHSAQKPEKL
jgi:large subunit ribosomal protein L13